MIALNKQSHYFHKSAEGKLKKLDKFVGRQKVDLQLMSGIFKVQSLDFFSTTLVVTPVVGKANGIVDGER